MYTYATLINKINQSMYIICYLLPVTREHFSRNLKANTSDFLVISTISLNLRPHSVLLISLGPIIILFGNFQVVKMNLSNAKKLSTNLYSHKEERFS